MGFGAFPYPATETGRDSSQAAAVAPSCPARFLLPHRHGPARLLPVWLDWMTGFGSFWSVLVRGTGLGRAQCSAGSPRSQSPALQALPGRVTTALLSVPFFSSHFHFKSFRAQTRSYCAFSSRMTPGGTPAPPVIQ